MPLKILISDPDKKYAEQAVRCLTQNDFQVDVAHNGKDVQRKCFNNKYFAILLDVDTESHSGIEVLRYLKISAPSIRVVLTISGKKRMDEFGLSKKDFYNLGVSDILIKPYSTEHLVRTLSGNLKYEMLKVDKSKAAQEIEEEVTARDDLFTKLAIDSFYSGNASIFDIYVKLGANKYLKILRRGDFFSSERLDRYKKDKQVEYLYFKTKDRSLYIHYLNALSEKILSKPNVHASVKIDAVKSLSEKYIEEVYTEGLKPQLVEEGKKLCENVYKIIEYEKDLYKVLRTLEDQHTDQFAHAFLVSFFSGLICKKLEWNSKTTIQKITFGGMLHDIGKLKLDPLIRTLRPSEMTKQQFEESKRHPTLGVEMVSKYSIITTEIKQIISQHHELMDGEGYPEGLTGMKIYPLAQVVGFVDSIAWFMAEEKSNPVLAVKKFLNNRANINKYNQKVIKGLIKCLIKEELD